MSGDSPLTRRTVLQAAGITLGTAALGSAAFATSQSSTREGSEASVEWYNTYTGDDSITGTGDLFVGADGYVVIGNGRLTELTTDGDTVQSHSLPDDAAESSRTSDDDYLHASTDWQSDDTGLLGLVFKTDDEGNELWSWSNDHEEGNESGLWASVAGPDGGGYGFGHFGTDGEKYPFGVRLDADGNVVWKEWWKTGSVLEFGAKGAVPATNGGAFVYDAGSAARITADGAVAWTNDYGDRSLNDVVLQPDGGYVVLGTDYTQDRATALFYLNERGELTRTETFDLPGGGSAKRLGRTDAGFVVGGTRSEEKDDYRVHHAQILGLTPAGDRRWYLEPGDESNEENLTAMVGGERNVLVGGAWKEGQADEDLLDEFVAKISEETTDGTETDTGDETDSGEETETETAPETDTETVSGEKTETQTDEEDCEI